MKLKLLSVSLLVLVIAAVEACTETKDVTQTNYTQYVDPRIGSGGHGHVFVGANAPFGLVQAGPTQPSRGWDWCSGYHDSDSVIVGFGQMHLSGTGIGDLGDISILPVTNPDERFKLFSHADEVVKPGYYELTFPDGIKTEITATQRAAFYSFSYPDTLQTDYMILNLRQGIGWDSYRASAINQVSPTEITGFRQSRGWAPKQDVYFDMQFSRDVTIDHQIDDSIAVLSFAKSAEPLLVKIGISAVSEANAKANLEAEIPHWDFDKTYAETDEAWNEQLRRIDIQTNDEKQKRIFYTAMYHAMIAPSVFSDVNGEYRGADGEIHHGDNVSYTTLSLWDVYRAAFPLYSLILPEKESDFANTMLHIYKQQGKLPVWHLVGNETNCMVGNPAIPIVIDIALKGYDVDAEAVFEAAKASALKPERSLNYVAEYGFIPCDSANESVACAMEYAIADAAIARLAKHLGKEDDYKYFDERGKAYKKYFDKQTNFMRGLKMDGSFREPFDPFHSLHREDDYTEGNAWQYTWLVPQDVHGLVSLFESEDKFVEKLDSFFVVEGDLGEDASPDITGLIGQYAHGNEPSHHIAYMYNYVGQPWKGAEKIRYILDNLYSDEPDGLCGNEDVGQMSAWYILSSLGLYQVDPSSGIYVIGSPLFDEATINVGNGKTFRVKAPGNSKDNVYVQSAKLNGKPYDKSWIDFATIQNGGTLELVMGSQPSDFGTGLEARPK